MARALCQVPLPWHEPFLCEGPFVVQVTITLSGAARSSATREGAGASGVALAADAVGAAVGSPAWLQSNSCSACRISTGSCQRARCGGSPGDAGACARTTSPAPSWHIACGASTRSWSHGRSQRPSHLPETRSHASRTPPLSRTVRVRPAGPKPIATTSTVAVAVVSVALPFAPLTPPALLPLRLPPLLPLRPGRRAKRERTVQVRLPPGARHAVERATMMS
mmetsp:Transcript_7475/g.18685  ORF Transcript_7475/g.18685 Transcript_7475/m.18685 type:complete len:222 (+) Transcript_7475:101-766(+)